jgi:hypothetical protein
MYMYMYVYMYVYSILREEADRGAEPLHPALPSEGTHYTLYTTILYTIHYTLYTTHYTLYTIHYTL